jgi:D-sedoheptulose 7-phosphate isomerase
MGKKETISKHYLDELSTIINAFPVSQVIEAANAILVNSKSGTVFTAGNGGSASTASHMATDLGVGSLRRRNAIRIVSLVDNSAILTATANDLSYDNIFSQQLQLLGRKGDVFICFSASGMSQNLVRAVDQAKNMGITTISITGFDGGTLRFSTDLNIHIQTQIGSYGVVEDAHSVVSHLLTEMIRSVE